MIDITINYLPWRRPEFCKVIFFFLNKIKPENKKRIKLVIHTEDEQQWQCDFFDYLPDEIDTELNIHSTGNNYLSKISDAVLDDAKYSVKLDEDCFVNNHIWDYMIENTEILDNPKFMLVAPLLSTCVPTCDYFIDGVLNRNEKQKLFKIFLQRKFPDNLWRNDYSSLNKYTIEAKEWDCINFYSGVADLPFPFKGIHPLRISYRAHIALNDAILNNIDKVINKNNYALFIDWVMSDMYFTNSMFMIKSDVWRDMFFNEPKADNYDEVPLNTYAKRHNMKMLFIGNGFAVHTMHNCVADGPEPNNIGRPEGNEKEHEFVNKFYDIITNRR